MLVFFSACQDSNEITWEELEPVAEKKVKTSTFFGSETEISWPVFSKEIQKKNHQIVSLEGYYFEIETFDIESILESEGKSKTIPMIAVSDEYTSKSCGTGQFAQHEFCVLEGFDSKVPGEKIKLTGTLELNTGGDHKNLIRLVK